MKKEQMSRVEQVVLPQQQTVYLKVLLHSLGKSLVQEDYNLETKCYKVIDRNLFKFIDI
jgi:hypothetical protein